MSDRFGDINIIGGSLVVDKPTDEKESKEQLLDRIVTEAIGEAVVKVEQLRREPVAKTEKQQDEDYVAVGAQALEKAKEVAKCYDQTARAMKRLARLLDELEAAHPKCSYPIFSSNHRPISRKVRAAISMFCVRWEGGEEKRYPKTVNSLMALD